MEYIILILVLANTTGIVAMLRRNVSPEVKRESPKPIAATPYFDHKTRKVVRP